MRGHLRTRRWAALGGLLMALGATPASAADPVTRTTISEVGGAGFPGSSGSALLAFEAQQEVLTAASSGRVGGARIARDAHAAAFDGVWTWGGEVGAWFETASATQDLQFKPRTNLLESAYFDNELERNAAPLQAGDRAGFALAMVSGDASLPWERPRGVAGGQLTWKHAVTAREITSSLGGRQSTLDAVMFRADVVAVSGDVDARLNPVELPLLEIDLPRTYDAHADYIAVSGVSRQYASYFAGADLVAAPAAGKMYLRASVSGYVPEGRVRRLPGGRVVREWHLPIVGMLAVVRSPLPGGRLAPRSGLSLPGGGRAQIVTAAGSRDVDLAPGQMLSAGADGRPALGPAGDSATDAAASPDPTAAEDVAASFDHTATAARRVELPVDGLAVTVDPDFRGEGVLALRDARNLRIGKAFANAVAVPAISRAGEVIPLDRSNLLDLRVTPFRDGGGFRFTSTLPLDGQPDRSATQATRVPATGITVSAVYDLGDGALAFVDHQMFHGGTLRGGRVSTFVEIKSLTSPKVTGLPHAYVEVAQRGAVMHGSLERAKEFSGISTAAVKVGTTWADALYGTDSRSLGGTVTALAAPAPLLGRAPDPQAAIARRPVALTIKPPPPAAVPATGRTMMSLYTGLVDDPQPAVAATPQLGRPCVDPQISNAVAAPGRQIEEAWIEADPRTLYASVRLREVPTPATAPAGARYSVSWWHNSFDFEAQATMSSTGAWSFRVISLWGGTGINTTGDVLPGEHGVVRIAIPLRTFGWTAGHVLRDTAAHAYPGTLAPTESVPVGSMAYGLGREYRIAPCPGTAPVVVATRFELAAGSPRAGTWGDTVQLQGRLTSSDGRPLAGHSVSLSLLRDGAGRFFDAVTDADGMVTVPVTLEELPGTYELRLEYEGRRDEYSAASSTVPFEVRRAPSALDLAVASAGEDQTLAATLTGASGRPLAQRPIDIWSGGDHLGTVTTDEAGRATMAIPPRYRGSGRTYEARYGGDERHDAATGSAQWRPPAPHDGG